MKKTCENCWHSHKWGWDTLCENSRSPKDSYRNTVIGGGEPEPVGMSDTCDMWWPPLEGSYKERKAKERVCNCQDCQKNTGRERHTKEKGE